MYDVGFKPSKFRKLLPTATPSHHAAPTLFPFQPEPVHQQSQNKKDAWRGRRLRTISAVEEQRSQSKRERWDLFGDVRLKKQEEREKIQKMKYGVMVSLVDEFRNRTSQISAMTQEQYHKQHSTQPYQQQHPQLQQNEQHLHNLVSSTRISAANLLSLYLSRLTKSLKKYFFTLMTEDDATELYQQSYIESIENQLQLIKQTQDYFEMGEIPVGPPSGKTNAPITQHNRRQQYQRNQRNQLLNVNKFFQSK